MTKLLRLPFHAAKIVSLVALALSFALWPRTYWRADSLAVTQTEISDHAPDEFPTSSITVQTLRGGLWIRRTRYPGSIFLDPRPDPTRIRFESIRAPADDAYLPGSAADPNRWIVGFAYGPTSSMYDDVGLRVPLWSVIALSSLAPLLTLWRSARRSRKPDGRFCRACGYNLHATPGRCPECGTTPQ